MLLSGLDHYSTPTPTVRTREAANYPRGYTTNRAVLFKVVVRKTKMKENKENKKNKKKMVSLVIAAKDYKILHKTLEPIVGECGLEFNKSGLSILTQSPCKTMLCDITIDAEVFNDYDLAESFEVEWDLIMAEARGLMKDYNQGLIWIDIFEVDGEKLDVDYLCEMHHDIFKDSFTLHTTKNKPRVPKFDTNCVFEISKETLQKVREKERL